MGDLISAREMSVLSETLLLVLKQVGGLVVADLVPFQSVLPSVRVVHQL